MAAITLEFMAHELLGQLGPGKLVAVVHLLEVTTLDGDIDESGTLSPAVAKADEWVKHNDSIPHEQVLAELGLSMADWEKMRREPYSTIARPPARLYFIKTL